MYELHPALRLVRSLVKKPTVLAGVLAVLVMFLLSACASSPEEGVVIDKPGAGGEPAPFQRPTFQPGGQGMSSGHSGLGGF